MSDLSNYLAQHYLVADTKQTKKSKKKNKDAVATGLLITEDDDSSWAKSHKTTEDDELSGSVVGTSAEFRKTKKSNWKGLSGNAPSSSTDATADAILASVAAETRATQQNDDELPSIDTSASDPSVTMMADGTHAGLQSASAISAQLKKRQREERAEFERTHKGVKEAETVYRDATGRRIDISMRREAARKAAREKEDKAIEAKRALKGEVQIEEARRRREELEDAALMTVARHVDDEDLNRELKDQQRWNDPMAQFLTTKVSSGASGKKSGAKGRPIYVGAAPPNRYGIKPGYRWDGVDRGNGFEAQRFKALNRRERNKNLEYSWQMDE